MNAYQVPTDPTAVMGRRFLAWVIDGVIVLGVFFLMFITLFERVEVPEALDGDDVCAFIRETTDKDACVTFSSDDDTTVLVATWSDAVLTYGVAIAVSLASLVVLQGITGASIGKFATGIRVVRRDTGAACGVGRAFIRWILWVVDSAPWCLPLVGPITALASKGHRRVGDMGAGTLVVAKDAMGRQPFVPGLDTPMVNPNPWGGTTPAAGWGAPTPPTVPSGGTWGTAPPPAAPGWGGAAPAGDWSTPGDPTSPPTQPVPPPAPTEQPGVDAPMWDEARGTYIQWDPKLQQWMQWDDTTKQWSAIG